MFFIMWRMVGEDFRSFSVVVHFNLLDFVSMNSPRFSDCAV